ncbi:uncharacterized protein N7498_010407 [Penicillium cinerascens]|uniref:Inositolphosphotransferase Aur1/Ipt1 domain-containing protein n=1 Tax=Penicillium cinerascens TaxID=70096 RepID=A0A9W9M8W1_9EURO|nr:uncharacterized protein N7498_010407 [Penicillium cinerascens]KAJ5191422.1 hypothetical protein N7498_010407 [Penicillium cinerascens]
MANSLGNKSHSEEATRHDALERGLTTGSSAPILTVAVVAIFSIGTWINRRGKSYQMGNSRTRLLKNDDSESEEYVAENEHGAVKTHHTKPRQTIHFRLLRQFPFPLEIIYWLLVYWKAEHLAIKLLSVERLLHIDIELSIQQFMLNKIPRLMDQLARVYYSHIVVGVMFYLYCYSFMVRSQYKEIPRTPALENIIAFVVLSLWKCAPLRLLPKEYGLIEVLHKDNSGSTWTHNKFQLTITTMASLQFGDSVVIAFCVFKHSPHPHVLLRVVVLLWPMVMVQWLSRPRIVSFSIPLAVLRLLRPLWLEWDDFGFAAAQEGVVPRTSTGEIWGELKWS